MCSGPLCALIVGVGVALLVTAGAFLTKRFFPLSHAANLSMFSSKPSTKNLSCNMASKQLPGTFGHETSSEHESSDVDTSNADSNTKTEKQRKRNLKRARQRKAKKATADITSDNSTSTTGPPTPVAKKEPVLAEANTLRLPDLRLPELPVSVNLFEVLNTPITTNRGRKSTKHIKNAPITENGCKEREKKAIQVTGSCCEGNGKEVVQATVLTTQVLTTQSVVKQSCDGDSKVAEHHRDGDTRNEGTKSIFSGLGKGLDKERRSSSVNQTPLGKTASSEDLTSSSSDSSYAGAAKRIPSPTPVDSNAILDCSLPFPMKDEETKTIAIADNPTIDFPELPKCEVKPVSTAAVLKIISKEQVIKEKRLSKGQKKKLSKKKAAIFKEAAIEKVDRALNGGFRTPTVAMMDKVEIITTDQVGAKELTEDIINTITTEATGSQKKAKERPHSIPTAQDNTSIKDTPTKEPKAVNTNKKSGPSQRNLKARVAMPLATMKVTPTGGIIQINPIKNGSTKLQNQHPKKKDEAKATVQNESTGINTSITPSIIVTPTKKSFAVEHTLPPHNTESNDDENDSPKGKSLSTISSAESTTSVTSTTMSAPEILQTSSSEYTDLDDEESIFHSGGAKSI